jgi:uncharacterized protein YigA (DUF484 family)
MIKEEEYLKAKQIVQEYEKQLNISDVMVRNFEQDWRIGKYYISNSFEVVQYKGCGNGQHAMVGKGANHEDAVRILRERNKDWKFIEQRDVNGVMYFHYAP